MIQHHQDIPPPMNGCDYTVRLSYGVWQCMTAQQYHKYEDDHSVYLPPTVGFILLGILALSALYTILLWFYSFLRGY